MRRSGRGRGSGFCLCQTRVWYILRNTSCISDTNAVPARRSHILPPIQTTPASCRGLTSLLLSVLRSLPCLDCDSSASPLCYRSPTRRALTLRVIDIVPVRSPVRRVLLPRLGALLWHPPGRWCCSTSSLRGIRRSLRTLRLLLQPHISIMSDKMRAVKPHSRHSTLRRRPVPLAAAAAAVAVVAHTFRSQVDTRPRGHRCASRPVLWHTRAAKQTASLPPTPLLAQPDPRSARCMLQHGHSLFSDVVEVG